MRFCKKEALVLAILALLVTMGSGIQSAMAYFTTYVTARGTCPIFLSRETEIREEVSDWTKHLRIENTGEAECFVRVRAFSGSKYPLTYTPGENWTQEEDGWWYFSAVLAPGAQTSQLSITVGGVEETDPQDFQVAVVQEHTSVLYTPEGLPYADWELSANVPPKEELP